MVPPLCEDLVASEALLFAFSHPVTHRSRTQTTVPGGTYLAKLRNRTTYPSHTWLVLQTNLVTSERKEERANIKPKMLHPASEKAEFTGKLL